MALVPVGAVDRARDGAKQFARGFTPGQKAVTVATIAAVAIGGFFLMSSTGKPTYDPLFTNLQSSDVSNITAQLTLQKIPYQLAQGGTTILVPAGDVNSERLSLAQAGLPASSTTGLSLLDKVGVTTSNVTQQAEYLQAIQGELEQTIDSISGVSSSQVNVAIPATDNFALTNDAPTGASVMVTMDEGRTLTGDEVTSIVHLVGSSVPNLDYKQVTVADSNGDLLAGPGVTPGAAGGNDGSTAYDMEIEQKVEAYLDSVVGSANADVQVNSTLDNASVSTTTNNIIPGASGKPVSFCTQVATTDEKYTGEGALPSGVAGTITATSSSSGNNTYSNTSNTETCETNEQTQTVQSAPGTVQAEQVAVLVNSKAIPRGTNLTALQAGAAAAAGIDKARGDTIAFSSMPFTTAGSQQAAAAAKAAAAKTQQASLMSLAKDGAVLFGIAIVLFMLWRSARKARVAPSVLSASDIEALRAARPIQAPTASLPPVAEISSLKEAAQVNHFIDSQPDEVASMLRGWISQSDTKAHV